MSADGTANQSPSLPPANPLDDMPELLDSGDPEQLLRLFRETMRDQIRSNLDLAGKVGDLDEEVGKLASLIRSQSDVYAQQLREIHKKMSGRTEETDNALMQIAKELASIRQDQMSEAEARKKQDSIHEEEITGVKQNVAIVKAEASYAMRTLAMVKETVTTKNVAKGTFLAVVVSVIEAVIKNWDKIFS